MSRTETRGLARTILVLLAVMLVAFVLFTSVPPSGGIVNAQTSPSNNCGATIQWLNPSANGLQGDQGISDENAADPAGADRFHLVAWVSNVPSGAEVDFRYKPSGNANEENIEEDVAKSGSLYEFFWDIAPTLDDTTVTLRAILATNGVECTRDEQSVFINNDSAAPVDPSGPTVEIKDPVNNQAMGFYKNPAGVTIGVLSVNASGGATYVRGVYSVSTPGTEPAWKSCGDPATASEAEDDGIRCTLAAGDDPNEVTAVGAVANGTPDPLPYDSTFDGSSDAHRVASYFQNPSELMLEFLDSNGNPTGPSSPNQAAGMCSLVLRATVTDQIDRPIPAMNVDFHAKGPGDDLGFAGPGDAFKNPDMGTHSTPEAAKVCPLGTQSTSMQGEHDRPGGEADEKHIESTNGTNNAGQFSTRLFSTPTGVTQITAWADVDGDDEFCSTEQSDDAAIGWGTTQSANVQGLDPEETTCIRPNVSPSPSSAPPTPTSTQTSSPSTTTSTTATTSSPGGDRRVATNLSINYDRPVFKGKTNSSVAACERGRRVVLKKLKPGKDKRAGEKKTNSTGAWKLRKGKAKGRYYAVVAKKVFTDAGGTTVICQRDRSKNVRARRNR